MDAKEFEVFLNDTESRLERLKALYEQYFQGLERLEPLIPRKDLERRLQALRKERPRNTALRFRMQSVVQRWTSYTTYWGRVARQIEEGTYRRDVLRARKLRAEIREREIASTPSPMAQAGVADDEIGAALARLEPGEAVPTPSPPEPVRASRPGSDASPAVRTFGPPPGVRPLRAAEPASPGASAESAHAVPAARSGGAAPAPRQAPPPPPVAARAPAGPATRSGLSEAEIRSLYERYVDARRRNNEKVENLKYEAVANSLRAMVPKLREKHGGQDIGFEVVVKDGRVGFKPITKK